MCSIDCIVEKHTTDSKLMFIYVVLPVKIPKNKRHEIATYSVLFNNNLKLGCWELNMENGTMRFRISYLYDEQADSFEQLFMGHLDYAIKFTDICIPGIFSVIYSDSDPAGVYRKTMKLVDVRMN